MVYLTENFNCKIKSQVRNSIIKSFAKNNPLKKNNNNYQLNTVLVIKKNDGEISKVLILGALWVQLEFLLQFFKTKYFEMKIFDFFKNST